jgi:Trypsin-like peptidase domain
MLFCLSLPAFGLPQPEPASALRAAVPLLCTENNPAFRTYVRGTGLIADSGGTLLTAAHVILQARFNCTLSVMIPDDEWVHAAHLRRFLLARCHLNEVLDLAVCRIQPAENPRDLAYIRAAPLSFRSVTPGEPVSLTGFTGWVLAPLTRTGRVTGQEDYRRQDGCRCDFATNILAVEGMSGSPVISYRGEVLGIITQAGKGKFRGTSFGVTLEQAKAFLLAEGVLVPATREADWAQPPPAISSFFPLAAAAPMLRLSISAEAATVHRQIRLAATPARILVRTRHPLAPIG